MTFLKRFILALMLIAGAIVLALPPRPRAQVPRGRVEIRYWEKWSGLEADQMKQIVDEFNRTVGADKRIFVRYMSMSEVDQKTLVATAAGVPPDVAGIWDAQFRQFASMDALEPLDDLAAEYGLTAQYYKPVYYSGCWYDGRLYGLPSTPAATALHWNKRLFEAKSAELRAAGLDPDRPPRTLQEFDRYTEILDSWQVSADGSRRLLSAGHIPIEPGWFLPFMPYWFGGDFYDPRTRKLTLTDPKVIAAFEWIASYSTRLGEPSMNAFKSGFGSFDSPQNAFLTGAVATVLQGPWMANYIGNLKPPMNNRQGLTKSRELELRPDQRKANYEWGAAPFPSAVPGLDNVAYCGFDVLVIPRGCRHRREAFEFIAFVNRQDIMEKLCNMHSKNSPLANVSDRFLREHVNPYIDVFETLASSPNARGLPEIPNWLELNDELRVAAQRVYELDATPRQALRDAQDRAQSKLDRSFARQSARERKSE